MKKLFYIMLCFFSACHSVDEIVFPEGGYAYPVNVKASDTLFYRYPLKDSLTRRDSMWEATSYFFYQPYKEPNLSIHPMDESIFRFVYASWLNPEIIITLTKKAIIMKSGYLESAYIQDSSRLTPEENKDFIFLKNTFPLDTVNLNRRGRAFYDSVFHQNPRLNDVGYLLGLKRKITILSETPFKYSTQIVKISDQQYKELVDNINRSGFWKLPYTIPCKTYATDGGGLSLEANTTRKYNYVSDDCPDGNTPIKKVWQKLISVAGLEKEIHLILSHKEMVDSIKAK